MSTGIKKGMVKWKSPSNIALIKYWGKHGRQIPQNPSISLTLNQAHTITSIAYQFSENPTDIHLDFKFEGLPNPSFEKKIISYLKGISDIFPLINHLELNIESANSFPHSSGIASSASAMSALALCLVDIESQLKSKASIDMQKVSILSRLGSGSACRSVYGPIAVWGTTKCIPHASDEYAIPYSDQADNIFTTFHDDILIVSAKEKSVSSRAGHALMEKNIYASARFDQAHLHMQEILIAMKNGDLNKFGYIAEKEALTLHALMMASDPPYMLMEPATIKIIQLIREFREDTNLPVFFTLDAGPNIHMLYPDEIKNEIHEFKKSIQQYCEGGLIISDMVGKGPEKLA